MDRAENIPSSSSSSVFAGDWRFESVETVGGLIPERRLVDRLLVAPLLKHVKRQQQQQQQEEEEEVRGMMIAPSSSLGGAMIASSSAALGEEGEGGGGGPAFESRIISRAITPAPPPLIDGFLILGPSGTGKTVFALEIGRHLSKRLGAATFVSVTAGEIVSKVVGETEVNFTLLDNPSSIGGS